MQPLNHELRTIFFCMVNFWPLYCFENVCIVLEQVWLGFDQGFDRRWTWSRSFKVINQTTNGFRTNKIRHSVIFCCIRLVKTRKGIITLIIVTITRLVYRLSNSLQRKKGVNNFFCRILTKCHWWCNCRQRKFRLKSQHLLRLTKCYSQKTELFHSILDIKCIIFQLFLLDSSHGFQISCSRSKSLPQ